MEIAELKTTLTDIQTMTEGFGAKLAAMKHLEERINNMETILNRPTAGTGFTGGALAEAKGVLHRFMQSGRGLEEKQLQGNIGAQGGFAVPSEIDQLLTDQLVTISPMRAVAQVVSTSSPDYSKLIGRRGTGTGWTGETGTRDQTAPPSLAKVSPSMGEVYSYATVTRHVIEDAVFNIEAWLQDNIATEFAVKEATAFISGNGVNQPRGFLNFGTGAEPVTSGDDTRDFGILQYIPTGAVGAFDATNKEDVFFDTVASLKAPYRVDAVWMMNSTTAAAVRKLKDGDGKSLWNETLILGQPSSLLGYPVIIAEDMPDIGANSYAIAFGNFQRGYLIADRAGLTMVRDEVTTPGFIKFYVAKRVGGTTADTNAIKVIKFAAS